LIDKFKKKG